MPISKTNLSLAGEFRVAAALLTLDRFAAIPSGNRKATDIITVGSNQRAVVIEVKSSQKQNFVTGVYQKYSNRSHPACVN